MGPFDGRRVQSFSSGNPHSGAGEDHGEDAQFLEQARHSAACPCSFAPSPPSSGLNESTAVAIRQCHSGRSAWTCNLANASRPSFRRSCSPAVSSANAFMNSSRKPLGPGCSFLRSSMLISAVWCVVAARRGAAPLGERPCHRSFGGGPLPLCAHMCTPDQSVCIPVYSGVRVSQQKHRQKTQLLIQGRQVQLSSAHFISSIITFSSALKHIYPNFEIHSIFDLPLPGSF